MKIDIFQNKRNRPESDEGIVEVTIGICAKNSERTIKETIASILNQSFSHERTEIIVVDDGSTDRTLSIVTTLLSKANIRLRLCSTNGNGLGMARQMVVNNSRGRFVVWIDSDMTVSKDFIQKQVDAINKSPLIGVVSGKLKCSLKGSIAAKLETLSRLPDFELANRKKDIKRVGTGASIMRLSAIIDAGGFDRRIRGAAEDADITGRIKSSGYLLCPGEGEFEHEFKQTWKGLWNQWAWYGYGVHYLHHKNKNLVRFRPAFFPISFAEGIIRSTLAFKVTLQMICFLLPFLNLFKTTAWWFGFIKAHKEGYGHNIR